MTATRRVVATFEHLDCLLAGAELLRRAGIREFEILSPVHRAEIDAAARSAGPSPLRWWTVSGLLAGAIAGFALPALAKAAWPMISAGAMPAVSVLPLLVLSFECAILLGACATVSGLLWHAGLPARCGTSPAEAVFRSDRFGIVLRAGEVDSAERLARLLERVGATTVHVEAREGEDD